ncbi:MAG TPA: isoprenylcysteine carboxylmethyltransferase family protein [Anaerolineales bacterium]|nr:isoprenylcysteine carboxylmethyltransferase family protein [Anaerolineales bacterium]
MKNILVTSLATIVVPGAAVFLVPYLILQATGELAPPQLGVVEAVSIAFAIVGMAMVIWVSVVFVTHGEGTPVPIEPPRNFVAAGLYRFVRNPMYLGAILVLFAEAALFRSLWILLYAGALWLALHTFTVFLEEPQLERRFGDTYREYKASTPRWLPRRPRGG